MEKFKKGDNIAVFGKIEFYQGYRIIHPEFDILDDNDDPINTSRIVPLYASNNILKNAGFDSRGVRRLINKVFKKLENDFDDYFDQTILKEQALLNLNKAFYLIHNPSSQDDIDNALYRLKFNEHFFLQLMKALNKKQLQSL